MKEHVFPFEVGDTIYFLYRASCEGYLCLQAKVIEITISHPSVFGKTKHHYKGSDEVESYLVETADCYWRRRFYKDDFGKLIFVNKKEAIKAKRKINKEIEEEGT